MPQSLEVNGQEHNVGAPSLKRLLDVLREDLGLTGSKEGCGEGECGACTVLLDGRPVNSCLIPLGQAIGHSITTVEGLGAKSGELLHPIQNALVEFGGTQCGICTPGIVMAADNALKQEPQASRDRLRELMAGNLCRCTGYQLIVDAVVDAALKLRKDASP